jgi:hypothetical protein
VAASIDRLEHIEFDEVAARAEFYVLRAGLELKMAHAHGSVGPTRAGVAVGPAATCPVAVGKQRRCVVADPLAELEANVWPGDVAELSRKQSEQCDDPRCVERCGNRRGDKPRERWARCVPGRAAVGRDDGFGQVGDDRVEDEDGQGPVSDEPRVRGRGVDQHGIEHGCEDDATERGHSVVWVVVDNRHGENADGDDGKRQVVAEDHEPGVSREGAPRVADHPRPLHDPNRGRHSESDERAVEGHGVRGRKRRWVLGKAAERGIGPKHGVRNEQQHVGEIGNGDDHKDDRHRRIEPRRRWRASLPAPARGRVVAPHGVKLAAQARDQGTFTRDSVCAAPRDRDRV